MKLSIARSVVALLSLAAIVIGGCAVAPSQVADDGIEVDTTPNELKTGAHLLVADQYNNRIVELDSTRKVVWSFGDGSSVAGPKSVVAPNDAERIGSFTLITATGAPAGAEPSCKDGCNDSRVILIDRAGTIAWQYGKAGVTGAGDNELNAPVASVYLPNGHVLITDQGNARVIEVNKQKKIVWQYGQTGISGLGADQLDDPNSAELLPNGNILIADEGNNRVIEVNRNKEIVWQYGSHDDTATINGAAFASRLPNGNTLISDAGNNRIVEVNAKKQVVFTFVTNTRKGSVKDATPTRAVRLKTGNTLISDQNNHQVLEVDSKGKIIFTVGTIAASGKGFNQLNGPYDAKVIGDFTGLTSPFDAY